MLPETLICSDGALARLNVPRIEFATGSLINPLISTSWPMPKSHKPRVKAGSVSRLSASTS